MSGNWTFCGTSYMSLEWRSKRAKIARPVLVSNFLMLGGITPRQVVVLIPCDNTCHSSKTMKRLDKRGFIGRVIPNAMFSEKSLHAWIISEFPVLFPCSSLLERPCLVMMISLCRFDDRGGKGWWSSRTHPPGKLRDLLPCTCKWELRVIPYIPTPTVNISTSTR